MGEAFITLELFAMTLVLVSLGNTLRRIAGVLERLAATRREGE